MNPPDSFSQTIQKGYTFSGPSISLGAAMYEKNVLTGTLVNIPLKTLNRHGLVAGATGTGKTKTLQRLAESLSEQGVPVLLMDIKGDISGLSQPGTPHEKVTQRQASIGVPWTSSAYPVEYLTISHEHGVRMRATVSEFGPVLFSKILELNDTQESIMNLLFKYADDHQLALVDLSDLRKLIQYLTNEGKKELAQEYGSISTSSIGLILRKIVEIEQQGANFFFGEPSFDVDDLTRLNDDGKGYINILRLMDIQDRPKMFSTFMLSLLAEVYRTFPEEGDLDQPKLVIMIDEAHLIFKEATKALLNQLETVIKLIRSKGVGIIFCTQSPQDIPAIILSQLGLKIQHALRAFTASDRQAIKLVSQNYPETQYYKIDQLITELGIGEALVTALSEKGSPTPLVHAYLCSPSSRMDTITEEELSTVLSRSSLKRTYEQTINPESAAEILAKRLSAFTTITKEESSTSMVDQVSSNPLAKSIARTITSTITRQITGQITRGILGMIMGGRSSRRSGGYY